MIYETIGNEQVRSGFRPSGDATKLPYFIPGNVMLLVNLRRCADILEKVVGVYSI